MSYLRDWRGYNEALVKKGLILLDLNFVCLLFQKAVVSDKTLNKKEKDA